MIISNRMTLLIKYAIVCHLPTRTSIMHFGIFEAVLFVFFTALIVSVIFRQLKLSVILGYLVVGALVGPHAFALIPDSNYINNLAQFGIVFLMFTVGLEFSLSKLFALRNAVFVIGGLQVLICVVVTTVIGMLLGMTMLASLVVGSIVAMSSTALVIKQLNDQFELQSRHGLNAVGILLFQDLAVIPLVILITSIAKGAHQALALTLLWAVLKGALAIFLIFVMGRWLLQPLFKLIAKARAIELFTLSVLLITLSAAWVTEILGLSYSLGAFLAGIMLAETTYRHQIEVEIRPFRDMLLALFFISIGMLADMGSWIHTWVWIALLVTALIIGKMLVIIMLSRFTKNYYSTAARTGIVLAQGGEFGFAILTIAMSDNMMPPEYQQVILAALLISIAIAPLLIRFNKEIATFFLPTHDFSDSASQHEIIKQAEKLHDHVIICGYKRVGQHMARLLDKIQFPYIAIDIDAELVQRASLAGDNVIYGDSAHPGILRKAGIENAKVLLITLSDHRAAIKILSIARSRYPNLPILVRCRDKAELDQFKKLGATHIIAEIFEASLTLSNHLLQVIQMPRDKILHLIQEIRNTDYDLLQQVFMGGLPEDSRDIEGDLHEQLSPIVISENAFANNKRLSELKLKELGVEVMAIRRGDQKHLKPKGNIKIHMNDIVIIFGSLSNLEVAERRLMEGV